MNVPFPSLGFELGEYYNPVLGKRYVSNVFFYLDSSNLQSPTALYVPHIFTSELI